jgi:hypothetical protein
MSKLDISKIASKVLAQQHSEKQIETFKIFYKNNLQGIKNRQVVLSQLYDLCIRFQKLTPHTIIISDPERSKLESETESFLKKYFSKNILELYHREIPTSAPKRKLPNPENKFWISFIDILSQSFEVVSEKSNQELNYKKNFLIFLNDCFFRYGLHPDILKRNIDIYKRYNIVLEHHFKSPKTKQTELKSLMKLDILKNEFITPYENRFPIKINGKLIPFKSIYQIKITSTLLLDDEIELFAAKNNFAWTEKNKEQLTFIYCCQDETETFHRNPYLIDQEKEKFRNQNVCFVNPTTIVELQKIKSKEYDLIKLIQLCKELNYATSTSNLFSTSLLVRAIIDHIPPIFGFKNFSEVANNYSGGTRSFKKSMQTLNNSLRNIADNNIHSQVRNKEVLTTTTQVDFTQELDLLLSEIVRILK